MTRRDFVSGFLKCTPALIVAGVAFVSHELSGREKSSESITFMSNGQAYKIKAEAIEKIKTPKKMVLTITTSTSVHGR